MFIFYNIHIGYNMFLPVPCNVVISYIYNILQYQVFDPTLPACISYLIKHPRYPFPTSSSGENDGSIKKIEQESNAEAGRPIEDHQ